VRWLTALRALVLANFGGAGDVGTPARPGGRHLDRAINAAIIAGNVLVAIVCPESDKSG
jgi:hypothetical protein